jgi:uncharacterized protein
LKKLVLLLIIGMSVPSVHAQSTPQVCFKDACVAVEVADTDAARIRGLQGRFSLNEGTGMLFVFPQQDVLNFWMKDTLIPLDLIWINEAKQVVDIKSVPPCQENPCPIYTPAAYALYVLEINAGAAQKYNINVGDTAVFKK